MERVREFLASRGYSPSTEGTYSRVLSKLIGLDLSTLTAAGLVQFVSVPGWGSSHRHTALCACLAFLRWLNPSHPALCARVRRIPTAPQPRLSRAQVLALLVSFDMATPAGCRDAALVGVALDCNLRATELCNLELGNIDLGGCKLFALVKGGQWAWKTFSTDTADLIRAWVDVREPALGVGTLFVSFNHQHYGRPLTRSGLQQIMKAWGRSVGFHVSPHMFRRSYASQMTRAGAPRSLVKLGGGWKSDNIVEHYIGDLEIDLTRRYLPMLNIRLEVAGRC